MQAAAGSGAGARVPRADSRSRSGRLGPALIGALGYLVGWFPILVVVVGVLAGPAAEAGPAGGLEPDTGGVELSFLLAGLGCMVLGFAIIVSISRSRRAEDGTTTRWRQRRRSQRAVRATTPVDPAPEPSVQLKQ